MAELFVTCIIPCRNAEDTVCKAIESALVAGCDQVLVFDDASTDASDRVIYDYYRDSLRGSNKLTVFSVGQSVRSGVNFARNYLVEEAQDGLIIPLDADDTLRDIKPFKQAYEPNTWVYGAHVEHDGEDQTQIRGHAPGVLGNKNITGVTFLYHKSDWIKAGGYDPDFSYLEDYGFQCALTNAGVQPKRLDLILYDRYLKPTGNERTKKAEVYWPFFRDMAREKYQKLFAGAG